MSTGRPYQDYTDNMLETVQADYAVQMLAHGNYQALAQELARAHDECDVQSNARDMAEHHERMAAYYHRCGLEVAAEQRARDNEADKAAEQYSHNRDNGC